MNTPRDTEWAALLRRANRGDRVAYTRFLTAVAPVLRGVIRARSRGRPEECEDILQNTLIAIHEKRHTWREGDPVTPWLYAIARYKTADAWRRHARDLARPMDEEAMQVADPRVAEPGTERDVAALLAGLDETSAEIVRAMKLRGDSAGETGERLGMSAGAVRVALHRALARLSAAADGNRPKARGEDEPDDHR